MTPVCTLTFRRRHVKASARRVSPPRPQLLWAGRGHCFRFGKCLTLLAVIFAVVVRASAEGIDLEGGPELPAITTEELAAVVRMGGPVLLVDARNPETYAQGHLPGAINVPADRVDLLASTLPKEAVIVVYCGGPECPHSLLVGRWLVTAGWPKVLHYRGGFPAWQEAGHAVATDAVSLKAEP